MDYDRYSADDQIGKVYLNLNPLLFKECGHQMFGFYPIFDTMAGCRGEIFCIIKMETFSDSNKFKQTSCGIRFFHAPQIPYGYYCTQILGFVEELVGKCCKRMNLLLLLLNFLNYFLTHSERRSRISIHREISNIQSKQRGQTVVVL